MANISIQSYREQSDNYLADAYQRKIKCLQDAHIQIDKGWIVNPKKTERSALIDIIMQLNKRLPAGRAL
jgi:CTP-dependent riboflavin kinase